MNNIYFIILLTILRLLQLVVITTTFYILGETLKGIRGVEPINERFFVHKVVRPSILSVFLFIIQ